MRIEQVWFVERIWAENPNTIQTRVGIEIIGPGKSSLAVDMH